MAKVKQRADVLLVERGLAESRQRAQALIMSGAVSTPSGRVQKAGETLAPDVQLHVKGNTLPYVSRGGLKLAHALDVFDINVLGVTASDFGASTGGFTDCLLQRGAAHVFAIDVGYGQLHEKLRQDHRVTSLERTNARHITMDHLTTSVGLVVIDASFIGLVKLLPAARSILKPRGTVVALIKPQFEVGNDALGKHGVVKDESTRLMAIDRVIQGAVELGFEEQNRCDSPIRGPRGNLEALVHLTLPPASAQQLPRRE